MDVRALIVAALVVILPAAGAADPIEPVPVHRHAGAVDLTGHVVVIKDPTGRQTASDVMARADAGHGRPDRSLKPWDRISSSAWWLIVDLWSNDTEPRPYVLRMIHIQYDFLDAYVVIDQTIQPPLRYGDHRVQHPESLSSLGIAFDVTLPPEVPTRIMIRLAYKKAGVFNFQIFGQDFRSFVIEQNKESVLHGIRFGIFIASLILALVAAIGNSGRIYIIYCCYVMSLLVCVCALEFASFGSLVMSPGNIAISDAAPIVSSCLLVFTAMQFSRSYLETKERSPTADRILTTLTALSIVPVVVLVFVSRYAAITLVIPITVTLVVLPVIGLYIWWSGHPLAWIFVLAWIFMAVGCLIFVARLLGLLDASWWVIWVPRYAPVLDVLVLSIALSWRIRLLRERSIRADQRRLAAEQAARAKQDVLSTVSHEIRTPLSGVVGMTHLALRSDPAPQTRAYLEKSLRAARSLLNVVNGVLDHAKIEAGKLALVREPFRLDDVLDAVAITAALAAEEKGLKTGIAISDEVPRRLVGDARRLEQVLLNLVGNAVKFTKTGTIEVAVEVAATGVDRVTLRFSVRDTGIGMTPDQMSRLFTDFGQGDDTISRRFGGTGLGLSICRHLVELMGGEIWAESGPALGSVFRFTVPLGQVPAGADDHRSANGDAAEPALVAGRLPAAAGLVGRRILLVEDNPINREITCALLTDAGAVVEVAHHGGEAIDKVIASPFDLVLMDLQMPVIDGDTATRRIRALPGRAHLPIIAMTACATAEDRARCAAAGMTDHIAKPSDPARLLACVVHHLGAAADDARAPPPATVDLPALPGVDVSQSLARLGGDRSLYLNLLIKFSRLYHDTGAAIRDRLASGDRASARAAAHALAGAAANLGMDEVFTAAGCVEKALTDRPAGGGAALGPLVDALERAVAAACRSIDQALTLDGRPDRVEPPAPDLLRK